MKKQANKPTYEPKEGHSVYKWSKFRLTVTWISLPFLVTQNFKAILARLSINSTCALWKYIYCVRHSQNPNNLMQMNMSPQNQKFENPLTTAHTAKWPERFQSFVLSDDCNLCVLFTWCQKVIMTFIDWRGWNLLHNKFDLILCSQIPKKKLFPDGTKLFPQWYFSFPKLRNPWLLWVFHSTKV